MIITVYPPLACRNIPGNPSIAGDFLYRLSEDILCFSHKERWYQVQITLNLHDYSDIITKLLHYVTLEKVYETPMKPIVSAFI